MKSTIRNIRRILLTIIRLNVVKTLYVNFRCLPFRQAIHLPIHLFGRVAIHTLRGKISIDTKNVSTGMIRIGYRWFDLFPSSYIPTQLWVSGDLCFHGKCIISGGVGIFVQSKTATMSVGENVCIGGGSLVKAMNEVIIGDYTRITGNCVVMDSNMHYVKNIETGVVKKPWGSILIGRYCWINSGSIVTKGTVLPDYCVTARNTFLNKDYSDNGNNLFLVSSPAKVTSARVQRVFSRDKELTLHRYFMVENPEAEEYMLPQGIEVESGNPF